MRTIILALGLALLAGGPAGAQSRPELRFDPNRIEFATPWAQSSPCLGDRSDPVCLAQTAVVCGILVGRPECRNERFGQYSNPQDHDRIEYRISRAGIVPFERVEAMQEDLLGEADIELSPMTARRAVIAQFVVRRSLCSASEASCEGALWTDILVVVERTRRGWTFVLSQLHFGDGWYAE
jgi:hypothetical protein